MQCVNMSILRVYCTSFLLAFTLTSVNAMRHPLQPPGSRYSKTITRFKRKQYSFRHTNKLMQIAVEILYV